MIVVHPCRATVGLHSREGLPQVGQGVDLVDQPEPLASLHPLFEGRQHPFRPNRWFCPVPPSPYRPEVLSFSCLLSPLRHCRRLSFLGLARHVSTFLRSLRSRPVRTLLRYYGRSDSCPLRRGSARVISRRPPDRLLHEQVSLIHVLGLPTIPSPTTPVAPTSLSHATPQLVGLPPVPRRSGLRHSLAGSPHTIGRIEFLIVRTGRSPPVASHTVSRRNLALRRVAVTFGYRPESVCLKRTFTPPTRHAFRRTRGGFTPPRGTRAEAGSPLQCHMAR